jgi:hypothetical protein
MLAVHTYELKQSMRDLYCAPGTQWIKSNGSMAYPWHMQWTYIHFKVLVCKVVELHTRQNRHQTSVGCLKVDTRNICESFNLQHIGGT